MGLIFEAWILIKENRRVYLTFNAVYYGLVVIGMIYVAFNQPLQERLIEDAGLSLLYGPLNYVAQAYLNADVILAIGLTFLVNLLVGSFATITLPSLVVPFSGVLIGFYRAILWGLLLSPAHPDLRMVMLPHALTLILEGQAYILAMFAAYLHGRSFLRSHSRGIKEYARGYLEGLKKSMKIYILVILALLLAAIYEVAEILIMIKLQSGS